MSNYHFYNNCYTLEILITLYFIQLKYGLQTLSNLCTFVHDLCKLYCFEV